MRATPQPKKQPRIFNALLFLLALCLPLSAIARWEVRHEGGQDLYAIWKQGDTILAVGAKGTIVASRDQGQTWKPQISNTQEPLYSIWGDDSHLFITGGNGTLLRSSDQGQTWSTSNIKERGVLRSVWGDGRSVFVVGDAGAILSSADHGVTWRREKSNTSLILHSLCGVSGALFVVGEEGLILRSKDDGRTWEAQQSGTKEILRACWRSPQDTLYAAGYQGVLLRSSAPGEPWTLLSTKTTEWLVGLSGSTDNVYVVGAKGALLSTMSGEIKLEDSTTTQSLYGVWASLAEVFAVGKGGVIIALSGPTLQLQPSDGTPFGAEVFVDQARVGVLPLPPQKLSVGPHQVEVRRDGYQSFITQIELSLGEDRLLAISLEPDVVPTLQPLALSDIELPRLRLHEPPPLSAWPKKLYQSAAVTASAALILGGLGIREARISSKLEDTTAEQFNEVRAQYERHQSLMRGFGISADLLGGASLVMVSVALYPRLMRR